MTKEALLGNPRPRYIVSVGGTRSGKTYSILQILTYLVECDGPGDITSVVSETLPHLKKGAIRDFEGIMGVTLKDDPAWNETDHVYTFPKGGKLEFFSVENSARCQGPARKRLFLNEGIHIKYETYRQLAVRTTGVIFIDLNPEFLGWVEEKIQPRKNCTTLHSTYKDNDFLSKEQVEEIESNKEDASWWRVYGEGLTGQREGLIFPAFTQVDDLPEISDGMSETYGVDYGFTNDTTAVIHCLIDKRNKAFYFDEIIFRKGMLNEDIVAVLKAENISSTTEIFADSAEPKTNEDIKRYGFNVIGADKSVKKAEQLQQMKGWKFYVTKRSLNMIRELRGYVWQQDKDGKLLNEPIGVQDHTMDAARYGVMTWIYKYMGKGNYSFS